MSPVRKVMRGARWVLLRARGAHIPEPIYIDGSHLVEGEARGFVCGPSCMFSPDVHLVIRSFEGKTGRLTIGAGTFINRYVIINCILSVTIGKRVQIGPHTYIGDFDHDIRTMDGTRVERYGVVAAVSIGDDVWLGSNVVVRRGVTIGSGAIIGAGSVVTRDIPENMVAYGNPARVVRARDCVVR